MWDKRAGGGGSLIRIPDVCSMALTVSSHSKTSILVSSRSPALVNTWVSITETLLPPRISPAPLRISQTVQGETVFSVLTRVWKLKPTAARCHFIL